MDVAIFGESLYFGSLYDHLIVQPIKNGASNLTVATGYASASFASHLLTENENVTLRLLIGMAKQSGITIADHNLYNQLSDQHQERFTPHYYIGEKPMHAKVYGWTEGDIPKIGFIGSPNFSWSAYLRHQEAAAEHPAEAILALYESLLEESLPAHDEAVSQEIKLIEPRLVSQQQTASTHGIISDPAEPISTVSLSLLTSEGEVHDKAGLNWGQREGRNPNEAYIPIPRAVHVENPDFFPPKGAHFIIQTDDGQEFVGVVAQENNKAIETPEGNYILGEYFRRRLGLEDGAYIHLEDLLRYGRTDINLSKIDDDLFLLDFSI